MPRSEDCQAETGEQKHHRAMDSHRPCSHFIDCRVWEGTTESGVKVQCLITRIAAVGARTWRSSMWSCWFLSAETAGVSAKDDLVTDYRAQSPLKWPAKSRRSMANQSSSSSRTIRSTACCIRPPTGPIPRIRRGLRRAAKSPTKALGGLHAIRDGLRGLPAGSGAEAADGAEGRAQSPRWVRKH